MKSISVVFISQQLHKASCTVFTILALNRYRSRTPIKPTSDVCLMASINAREEGANSTKKRFIFTKELELKLGQCIGLANTHKPRYSETKTTFMSILEMFCSSHEFLPVHEQRMASRL